MTQVFGHREFVITGPLYIDHQQQLLARYLPGTLAVASNQESDIPLLQGRFFPGKTYLYLCQDQQCQLPVATIDELVAQL